MIAYWTDRQNLGPDNPDGWRVTYMVGNTAMGSITCFNHGTYYPITQVRRFGAFSSLTEAAHHVEAYAVFDVVNYPVMGHA